MRRHWPERLIGLLGAAWFILIGIDPAAFGACPAHQAPGSVAAHAGHTMAMASGAGATAHHDAGAPDSQSEHRCTCPGSCCGPSIVVVPSVQPSFALSMRIAGVSRFAEYQYRAGWTDFVLPFANAPPQGLQA
ncbi:MAG: hypothetical protein JWM95_5578 [Gemmatimonadetes bacterium]|nr:hypothetical protein [Gemmatimonadota bacterium]